MTLDEVRAGGKAGLARALAEIERAPDSEAIVSLLDHAHAAARAHVVGMTGPPGVGKSTLMNALIASWRSTGRSVGCIAVDPSSRRSGGALLGDRTRLSTDPEDSGIFVRSMAARDRLGGLAELTVAAMVLMRAIYDVVLIETAARSFLHHQVRSLVGCLGLVGLGRWREEQIGEALEARDRTQLGLNAPACGLYFVKADYPGEE